MVHFAETNQVSSPHSMLQHIGRVATLKLVPRNFLRYLQTTLIMGGVGIVSEFMSGIVLKKQMKKKGFGKNLHFFNLNSLFLMIGI